MNFSYYVSYKCWWKKTVNTHLSIFPFFSWIISIIYIFIMSFHFPEDISVEVIAGSRQLNHFKSFNWKCVNLVVKLILFEFKSYYYKTQLVFEKLKKSIFYMFYCFLLYKILSLLCIHYYKITNLKVRYFWFRSMNKE